MGVLIAGMEMPNKKNGAVLIIYPDGKCAFEDGKTYQAVPVPEPHGRLGDLDAIKKKWTHKDLDLFSQGWCWLQDLNKAPTVIPASEEG